MHALTATAGVALLAVVSLGAGSCDGLTSAPLTPARSMAGTWTTPFAVPMNLQTNVCNGTRQNVGKQNWLVTWIITAEDGTSNGIDVEMHIQTGGATNVAPCQDGYSLHVPEPSPMFLHGTISGSTIQLYNDTGGAFDGNLTADNIAGTFGAWDCQIYCSGEQSESMKFILTKNK